MGIEKIPTKGMLGAFIAVGILAVILVAIPAARWFLLLSLPAGLLVAAVLYFSHRQNQ